MIEHQKVSIEVGAGGKLVVPYEKFDEDMEEGTFLDPTQSIVKLGKAGKREWAFYYFKKEILVKMIVYKKNPQALDSEFYYVEPHLLPPLADEIKVVRIVPFYSLSSKTINLWPLSVNIGLSWYDSASLLLRQSEEFLSNNVIRLISDKQNSRYQIRFKPKPYELKIPELTKDVGELLGTALGEDRFIRSADHHVYRELTEGSSL